MPVRRCVVATQVFDFQPLAVADARQLTTKKAAVDRLPLRAGFIFSPLINTGVLLCLCRWEVHQCGEDPLTIVKLEPLLIVGSTGYA